MNTKLADCCYNLTCNCEIFILIFKVPITTHYHCQIFQYLSEPSGVDVSLLRVEGLSRLLGFG